MLRVEAEAAAAKQAERAKLRDFGTTIGVRDTRKIVGRYNLTSEDVRNEATFAWKTRVRLAVRLDY